MKNKIKCKECKKEIKDLDKMIYDNIGGKFCSKKCIWARNKRQKLKLLEKKKKLKIKKHNSISFLTKKADKIWSEAVKINFNYICQYCGKTTYLNSHHLFTRARKYTRWELDNGICLCSGCHTLSSNFSMHKTPYEASKWLIEIKGEKFMKELLLKSNTNVKITPDFILNKIKILQNFIKRYNTNI